MLLEKTFLIISTTFLISLNKRKEALLKYYVLLKEIQLIFFFSVLMSVKMQNKSRHLFLNPRFHQFIFTAKLNCCEIKFVGEMNTKSILKQFQRKIIFWKRKELPDDWIKKKNRDQSYQTFFLQKKEFFVFASKLGYFIVIALLQYLVLPISKSSTSENGKLRKTKFGRTDPWSLKFKSKSLLVSMFLRFKSSNF